MKPINIDYKYGIVITIVVLLFGVSAYLEKGYKLYELLTVNGSLLNWKFVAVLVVLVATIVWIIMNQQWEKEYTSHQQTKFQRDNYYSKLKISESKRLTDVVTGIPNVQNLENDIKNYFQNSSKEQFHLLLIDLKNFRAINNKYGFVKTNELLRFIAQSVYQKMRKNEDMYKFSIDGHIYRMHSGGDEFCFIIEGNQVEALGFVNRLLKQFKDMSTHTKSILGKEEQLSFYCAVVELDKRDDVKDVFRRADDCYRIAKEGTADFSICWHPSNVENEMDKAWEKAIYAETRKLFQVMNINQSVK